MSVSAVTLPNAGPLVSASTEPPATSASPPFAPRERNAARVVSIMDCLLGRVAANTTDSAPLRNRFAQLVAYEPGTRGTIEDYVRAADAAGYGPAHLSLFSFHQMGTARMDDSACDPEGQVWGVRNAVV